MKGLFIFTLVLYAASFNISACSSVSSWNSHSVIDSNDKTIILYAYGRWPSYHPGYTLQPQVVLLNGGTGEVDCDVDDAYWRIGMYASYYTRQAITLDIDYWADGRNTFEEAADYVVATLDKLVSDGYLNPTFYLMGGSAGTAVMSAALDYHPSFVDRVERAIFVSGPFTDISRANVTGSVVTGLMDGNKISCLVSLNHSLAYDPDRYNQWIKPLMDNDGLRFFVAEDDDIFCGEDSCDTGTMYEEFLKWLSLATDGTENRTSVENLGLLWVFSEGGHDLFTSHPELLHDAFEL